MIDSITACGFALRATASGDRAMPLAPAAPKAHNDAMLRLRKASLVGLMAVAVSLAGLPQFQCGCARGFGRTVSLGLVSSASSSCCCGGGCCVAADESTACCHDAAPDLDADMPCCRTHEASVPDDPESLGLRPSPARCTGTLILAEVCTPPIPPLTLELDATSAFLASFPTADISPTVAASTGRSTWEADLLPPPTDRVIAFLHLLI